MLKDLHIMDWPLRLKMVALLIIVSVFPLAIGAFLEIQDARERQLTSATDLLAARADQLAGNLDSFHRNYQLTAYKLSRLPIVLKVCQTKTARLGELISAVHSVFDVLPASDPNVRGVAILDLSGRVKVATESQLINQDLSYLSSVREALKKDNAIPDLFIAGPEVDNLPTISYMKQIMGPLGKVGLVVIWIRAVSFWDIAKTSNELAGVGSFAVLFDQMGIRIGHSFNREIVFHPGGPLDPAQIDAFVRERRFGAETRKILEEVQSFPEQFDRAREPVPDEGIFRGFAPVSELWIYGVGRRLETVPWTLFYMIPEQSLLEPIAKLTLEKIGFSIAIIILSLIAGSFFVAFVLKPIRSLSMATRDLAKGEFGTRVAVKHLDEIGQLSANFNSMAEQIQEQASALTKSRDELEIRVQERTIELLQVNVALRESKARKTAVMEASIDAIMIMDDQGLLVEFNPAAEKIFGYSRNEVIGRTLADVIIPLPLRIPHENGLRRYLNTGEERVLNKRVEMLALRRDGTEFPAEVAIVRIPTEGRPLFTGYIRDITERKKAAGAEILKREKEAVEAANTELEAFSYSVSHDLRAPLRAIDGFSKILLSEAKEISGDMKEFLERIRYNTQKMGQLIDDLLVFSRLGRLSMSAQKIDISILVKQTLEEFKEEINHRHIQIHQGILPSCQGDIALLKQVWINLLSNAIKYSRQKEEAIIEIGTKFSENEKETIYFVRDNGVGFDMHYIGKLFGVFQRLHRAEDFEGTGVGLAIVKRVIERHGGRIWAEAAVNQGATFYFTLPKENKT